MNIEYMIDKLNIKDLPEMITTYLHQYKIKDFNNLRSYYSKLFDFIGEDVKNSYLNRVLKYLSSDTLSIINIIEDFNEGIYDNELLKFSKYLSDVINKTDRYIELYEKLNRCVNFIFFENNDNYSKVKTFHNNKEYDMFLFSIIKHSFATYQINLPGIMGKRLLEEALTTYYDSDYRKRIIQASAELGNELAINLHAAHIYKSDKEQSILLLLKNKNNAGELWQIAYELEYNNLSKEVFFTIKNELKNIITDNEFINKISITEKGMNKLYDKTLLYAFKMYYYIAEKFNFSKALNSLGKLMILDYVIYDNDRNKTIEIAKNYLNKAIRMGNINAATNLSMYYYENKEDDGYDKLTMKRLFESAASLGDIEASYYYGKILIEEGNFEDGEFYLKYAAKKNSGLANFELAKYYDLKNEYELAIENYKNAIRRNIYNASYDLTILYLKINAISKTKIPKDEMFYYLNLYKDKLDPNIKEKALNLLLENE